MPRKLAAWTDISAVTQAHLTQIRESGLPCLLMVTHALGGGVERHIHELIQVLQGRAHVLVLKPYHYAGYVSLQLSAGEPVPDVLCYAMPADVDELARCLQSLGVVRVHVHHVIGYDASLLALIQHLGLPVDLTLHDYTVINGNPTLTNDRGIYDSRQLEPVADEALAPDARLLRQIAACAARVIAPSHAVRQRVNRALPTLNIQVQAHPDRERHGPYPPPRPARLTPAEPLRVLCMGTLGPEKGAGVLGAVARYSGRAGLPLQFVLLGSAHLPLPKSVHVSGAYHDAQVPQYLSEWMPHVMWFPAQCPETWSYTLSAALEFGAPVLASQIGAFPERLCERPWSWCLPLDASPAEWANMMLSIREKLLNDSGDDPSDRHVGWPQELKISFYSSGDYLINSGVALNMLPGSQCDVLRIRNVRSLRGRSERAKSALLLWLVRIRTWPAFAPLLNLIPYRWQRALKRRLSRAPLEMPPSSDKTG